MGNTNFDAQTMYNGTTISQTDLRKDLCHGWESFVVVYIQIHKG